MFLESYISFFSLVRHVSGESVKPRKNCELQITAVEETRTLLPGNVHQAATHLAPSL